LRISLAVSPLPYDKIAVEVLKLTTLRGCFFTLRIGERHRLGFREFAISWLSGDPSIANSSPLPSEACSGFFGNGNADRVSMSRS